MEAFHAAYLRGEVVPAPADYEELILIPAVLHTPWNVFRSYPLAIRLLTQQLLRYYLAAGQGMRPPVLKE